jgi:hypothetical protein
MIQHIKINAMEMASILIELLMWMWNGYFLSSNKLEVYCKSTCLIILQIISPINSEYLNKSTNSSCQQEQKTRG